MSAPQVGKDGRWSEVCIFKLRKLQEAAAATPFSTSQGKTTLPTLKLDADVDPTNIQEGRILRIHYRIKPTNAVTYTLRLWRSGVDGATKPYEENMEMLYESDSGRASDTDYDILDREIPFKLCAIGEMWYSIEWSAAAGNCQGFIEVSGVSVK